MKDLFFDFAPIVIAMGIVGTLFFLACAAGPLGLLVFGIYLFGGFGGGK